MRHNCHMHDRDSHLAWWQYSWPLQQIFVQVSSYQYRGIRRICIHDEKSEFCMNSRGFSSQNPDRRHRRIFSGDRTGRGTFYKIQRTKYERKMREFLLFVLILCRYLWLQLYYWSYWQLFYLLTRFSYIKNSCPSVSIFRNRFEPINGFVVFVFICFII